MIRTVLFKVVYVNIADILVALYESESLEAAEYFAKHYDGAQPEVFIKKVYRLGGIYERKSVQCDANTSDA